jgi:hypothetical protein
MSYSGGNLYGGDKHGGALSESFKNGYEATLGVFVGVFIGTLVISIVVIMLYIFGLEQNPVLGSFLFIVFYITTMCLASHTLRFIKL